MSVVIASIVEGYRQESNGSIYFPVLQLSATLVLNRSITDKLPRNRTHSMPAWIQNNVNHLIGFHAKSNDLLPYLKEGILWGSSHNILNVSNDSLVSLTPSNSPNFFKIINDNIGLSAYHKTSIRTGRWFAHSGLPNTIIQIWRILL